MTTEASEHTAPPATSNTNEPLLMQFRGERRLVRDLIDSLRNPEFWALSAWLDIVVTYRRSRLGVIWLLMPTAIYTYGVGALFAGLWHTTIPQFAPHVALGWSMYMVLNSVINESTQVLYRARSFIMDGRMRLTDFVLRSMAKALFHFGMSIPIIVLTLVFYPDLHPEGFLLSAGAFVFILLNTFFCGVIFSIVGARFPDIHEVVRNIFSVLGLVTPIIWFASMAPLTSVRGLVARFNPLFHFIETFRAPILGQPLSIYSWYIVGAMTVVSFALAAFLYRRYARLVPIWL